jgi:hypothetical protein
MTTSCKQHNVPASSQGWVSVSGACGLVGLIRDILETAVCCVAVAMLARESYAMQHYS